MQEERQKLIKDIEKMTAERDRALRDGRKVKAKDEKQIGVLQAQVKKAESDRETSEAKVLEKEALAAEVAEQRIAVKAKEFKQQALAAEAIEQRKAAEAKVAEQEAFYVVQDQLNAEIAARLEERTGRRWRLKLKQRRKTHLLVREGELSTAQAYKLLLYI